MPCHNGESVRSQPLPQVRLATPEGQQTDVPPLGGTQLAPEAQRVEPGGEADAPKLQFSVQTSFAGRFWSS